MARLDRLGPAKEVIQIGAVIGSEFSYDLLHAVHPVGAEELQSALRSATDAELVYVRGIAPEATYQFKHALIRDAAYEALLKSRRKELHGQVAHTIDEKFPVLKEAHPEVIARHWTEAGETAQAFAAWTYAGKVAESHLAFKEAHQSYEQALALLSLLPESAKRHLHELSLRRSIVQMLLITNAVSEFMSGEGRRVLRELVGNPPRALLEALSIQNRDHAQLLDLMHIIGDAASKVRDFEITASIDYQASGLAVRNNLSNLAHAYALRVIVCFARGDLANFRCKNRHSICAVGGQNQG